MNRAKKVFTTTLSKAKASGLTLASTDYQPGSHAIGTVHHSNPVAKTTRKKARKITAKTSKVYRVNTGSQIVILHHDQPQFSKATLSLRHGAWQSYGKLDSLMRDTTANAMLNKRLMPSAARLPLYVDPTGWHNKKAHGTWLYNRCHLIGYQLTGQNNNLRNLITGTRSLNDPCMTRYENPVAHYLRESSHHYIRYLVRPVFKGNDLLASGVQMEGKSVGSNKIHFDVYIKNVQPGFVINYSTGTSKAVNY